MAVWCSAGFASELHLVRAGETVPSIAAALGDPSMADAIWSLNGLAPGAVAPVGMIIAVPDAHTHEQRPGQVLATRGRVTITDATGSLRDASVGDSISPGSVVCTVGASYATLSLAIDVGVDGGHDDLSLLDSTCVTIDASYRGHTGRSSVVSVSRGSVSVRDAEAPGAVLVRTDAGVTAGDSGGFRVSVEPNATRTEALTAAVAVLGGGGELVLRAMQGSRTIVGEKPGPAVDLLLPGAPLVPGAGEVFRRADFVWTPVPAALGYRVELSVAADFSEVVHVEEMPAALWAPSLLMLPYRAPGLWWRIASFDRAGFLGPPSGARGMVFPAGLAD